MKQFVVGVLLCVAIQLSGCGKVGDPLPPFVRVPEKVEDLAARQEGYNLLLSWTNPARYIDGSLATDLRSADVIQNGEVVASMAVSGPGQKQTHTIETGSELGIRQSFNVRIATTRGRMSDPSNDVSIEPVQVPGLVRNLRATVDQRRIRLEWDAPEENADLAQIYLAYRGDRPVAAFVMGLQYDDSSFQAGQAYEYRVIAARREPSFVAGNGERTIRVTAVDRTPPEQPMELRMNPSGDGILLTWAANSEADLAGYRVFKSKRPDGGFLPVEESLHTTNGFFDPNYKSDWYYAVSAVDENRNESKLAVFTVP